VDEVVGFDGIGMSKAHQTLNALQETPWRIDPEALAEAERQPLTGSDAMTLRMAQRYREWPFYFPYCFDDEGRARPVPLHLHPDGSELARSLLVPA
jgi:DNA-directed RNA polymerase